jgi:diguanylate cyclase (GGDEF)-like protein
MSDNQSNPAESDTLVDDVFKRWAQRPVRFAVGAPSTDDPEVLRALRAETHPWGVPKSEAPAVESEPPQQGENLLARLRPAVVILNQSPVAAAPDDANDLPLLMVLYVREGKRLVGRVLPLEATIGEIFIGRTPDNALVLDDGSVSRRHASLLYGDDGWTLRDLGSTNGTFVNGVRVREALLRDGDRVRVGGVILQGVLDAPRGQRVDEIRAHMETIDVLTDAATTMGLVSRMEAWANAAGRPEALLVVLDLDGLGAINQKYGELVGDDAIVAVAERLRRILPGGVTCARLGGGEFALWRSEPLAGGVTSLVEQVTDGIAAEALALQEGRLRATVTAAGTRVLPGAEAPALVLARVREAMRLLKRGRAQR